VDSAERGDRGVDAGELHRYHPVQQVATAGAPVPLIWKARDAQPAKSGKDLEANVARAQWLVIIGSTSLVMKSRTSAAAPARRRSGEHLECVEVCRVDGHDGS
jgi:hypothetical protein